VTLYMERLIPGAVMALGLVFLAPGGIATASPCEHRSAAHVAEHGGTAADNAWHVSHGQLPTCDTGHERESSARDQNVNEGNESRNDEDPDDKSRFCRRHFFC
jgi:hypothetical protein